MLIKIKKWEITALFDRFSSKYFNLEQVGPTQYSIEKLGFCIEVYVSYSQGFKDNVVFCLRFPKKVYLYSLGTRFSKKDSTIG